MFDFINISYIWSQFNRFLCIAVCHIFWSIWAMLPVIIIRIAAPDGDTKVLFPAQELPGFVVHIRRARQHYGYI